MPTQPDATLVLSFLFCWFALLDGRVKPRQKLDSYNTATGSELSLWCLKMGASFKVLIIKNIFTGRPWGTQMVDDIAAHIRRSIPDAQFEVCAAAEGQNVPDLSLFQLVVLTGGMLDLITSADEAWVQQVLSGVRGVMADDSETKLVGMCWGHQAIHLAMGGTIGVVPTGPRVSVKTRTQLQCP